MLTLKIVRFAVIVNKDRNRKTYYTSVVLHSNHDTTLPFSAHLGHIRPITNADKTVFAEAAKDMSEQLVNSWETYLYCQQVNQNTEQTGNIRAHHQTKTTKTMDN